MLCRPGPAREEQPGEDQRNDHRSPLNDGDRSRERAGQVLRASERPVHPGVVEAELVEPEQGRASEALDVERASGQCGDRLLGASPTPTITNGSRTRTTIAAKKTKSRAIAERSRRPASTTAGRVAAGKIFASVPAASIPAVRTGRL